MPTSQIVFCFFTILLTTGFVRGDEAHLKCFPTSIGEIVEIDIRINGKILSVSHIARNGVAYERMSQYHVYYSGSDKGLIWEGIHSRKQDLKMVGRLDGFSPTTQATYTEDLINANTGLLNQTKALCPALRKEQEVATSASAMVEAPEQTQSRSNSPMPAPATTNDPTGKKTFAETASPKQRMGSEPADRTPSAQPLATPSESSHGAQEESPPAHSPLLSKAEVSKTEKKTTDSGFGFFMLAAFLFALALYFLPFIVAYSKRTYVSHGNFCSKLVLRMDPAWLGWFARVGIKLKHQRKF